MLRNPSNSSFDRASSSKLPLLIISGIEDFCEFFSRASGAQETANMNLQNEGIVIYLVVSRNIVKNRYMWYKFGEVVNRGYINLMLIQCNFILLLLINCWLFYCCWSIYITFMAISCFIQWNLYSADIPGPRPSLVRCLQECQQKWRIVKMISISTCRHIPKIMILQTHDKKIVKDFDLCVYRKCIKKTFDVLCWKTENHR